MRRLACPFSSRALPHRRASTKARCGAAWGGGSADEEGANAAIERYRRMMIHRLDASFEASGYSPITYKDLAEVVNNRWRATFALELEEEGGDVVACFYGREVADVCYEGVVEVLNRYRVGRLLLRRLIEHPSTVGPSRVITNVPIRINLHAPEGEGRDSEWW